MAHDHQHEHEWSESAFDAFCKECGVEHFTGSTSAVTLAPGFTISPKPFGQDVSLIPASNPFDCAECIEQIEPTCTEDCFVTYDECNLCAQQAEKHPIWPLLSANGSDLAQPQQLSRDCCCPYDVRLRPSQQESCHQCQWANCNACFLDKAGLVAHVMTHLERAPSTGFSSASVTPPVFQHPFNPLPPFQLPSVDHPPNDIRPSKSSVAVDSVSNEIDIHQCCWEACNRIFNTTHALMDHVTLEHVGSGQSEYFCKWRGCPREHPFSQRQKVVRHLQGHIGDKPHLCEICKKSFSEKAALAQHLRTHSNDKPHTCPHEGCDKSFALASALTIHLRTHSGEKPFKCPFPGCDAAFSESSNLRKHSRTHTGEKSYQCPEPDCGKSFARSDQLTRHMKIHEKRREA